MVKPSVHCEHNEMTPLRLLLPRRSGTLVDFRTDVVAIRGYVAEACLISNVLYVKLALA